MKPIFSRLSSFWVRLRALFRWHALVFSRSTVYFLSHSPILNPNSDDFSMARHSFQPRNSLCPCFFLYFPTLRALLREIPPIISLRTPLFALREGFFISCFPHSSRPAPPSYFHCFPFRPTTFPPSSLLPPLSFSFLPTFPSPSPINARSRAPSRTTRVRVHPHTPARQEVFVYCLHRFTHPSQSTVHQRVRGEEKQEKAFTQHSITSQSTY